MAILALWAAAAHAAAGDLDPSFDGDGKLLMPLAGIARTVLVQPDGKIVVAGSTADDNFGVWRFNPGGSLDRSFDGDGHAAASFGGDDDAWSAALQPDGKIVLAGSTRAVGSFDDELAVARFNAGGSLDATFDPGGADGAGKKLFTDDTRDLAHEVLIQPDGVERARRRPRRTRWVSARRTLTRAGEAGPNRLLFSGRIGRRKLRPGVYRAVFAATDAEGNRSAARSARFRIVD